MGAGVAGLTVAHDLVQLGYKVTVFEAYSAPGGMLTAGFPSSACRASWSWPKSTPSSRSASSSSATSAWAATSPSGSLREQGFKAIFLGVGLPKGRKLDLPGADLAGVYDGMDFLRAFNEGNPLPVGKASSSSAAAMWLTTWRAPRFARKTLSLLISIP
jgi:hypothetical protein